MPFEYAPLGGRGFIPTGLEKPLPRAIASSESITVRLGPDARKGYALSVRNEGSTLPEGSDPAACDGLGMNLVSALAMQMAGEMRIDRGDRDDCTRFTVLFP